MYLVFDTETTDLPRPHLDLDHPAQPHLMQFAGVLFDENGRELDRLYTKVRPGRGALLNPTAYAAHGISLEEAFHQGMEISQVFRWFVAASQGTNCVIGHNVEFDLEVMAIVAARLGIAGWSAPSRTFCTMAHAAALVNLPPTPKMKAAGRYHPKPPTLAECIEHFFKEQLPDAHDALADVTACIRVFRHLSLEKQVA